MTSQSIGATAPTQFNFQSNAIRVITDDNGNPWFLANDVCAVLGYANPRQAIIKNCREGGVSKRYTPTESGIQEMTYIDEGNLYRLTIKSRKPEAEPFESWVCDEVLPSIRKTGQYRHQLPEPKTKKALPNGLTLEQQDCVKALVKDRVGELPKEKQAKAAITCWSAIKSKYGKTYKEVEPEHFTGMVSLIARLPLEGEYIANGEQETGSCQVIPDNSPADEILTAQLQQSIKNIIWDISRQHNFENAWIQAAWQAIRTATGNPSPKPFTVDHIPMIAQELRRILNVAEKLRQYALRLEKEILKTVIRGGGNFDEIMDREQAKQQQTLTEIAQGVLSVLDGWQTRELDEISKCKKLN